MLTEKYRPKTLDDVLGQEHIVPRLKRCVKNKRLSNLLFVGKPGIGKTSMAQALAHDMFGAGYEYKFYELNASDDRKLSTIREKVKKTAESQTIDGDFRIIFLDEADHLEWRAQPALRRIIEDYSDTCRFILSCNYGNKIIDPLVDRLVEMRFRPLSPDHITTLIQRLSKQEDILIDEEAYQTLAQLSNGSMRKAVTVLGSFIDEGIQQITPTEIEERFTWIDESYLKKLVDLAIAQDHKEADNMIETLLYQKLYTPVEILQKLHEYIRKEDFVSKIKTRLLMHMGEVEFRITCGSDPSIQLKAYIALMLHEFRNLKSN